MADKTTEKKRQTRTPRQRAEQAYGVADRAVKKLEARLLELTVEREEIRASLRDATARRTYLAADPALPQPGDLPDTVDQPAGGPITAAPDADDSTLGERLATEA